jgi:hypothetical protein
MAIELNHTILPEVYASKNGRRGTYFRDRNGHLMEILTPISGEPA